VTAASLADSREYLADQRRMIIARSIAGSLAAAVPVPFLDDRAIASVLGSGYRRIASARRIELDLAAQQTLVHGVTPPPSLAELAAGEIVFRVAGRAARRAMLALAAIGRAQSASRTFVTMTLFDHYCARLHTGLAIDAATALALRDEIDRAIDQTPGGLAFPSFHRGARSAARATPRAPLDLADRAPRGALRRLLTRRSRAAEAPTGDGGEVEIDRAVETELAESTGFLSRMVAAIEIQLSAEANLFLDRAIDVLDRGWRVRVAAGIK
jgi:hypothetical protein